MVQKQIYIITGGPGFGKTELINELRKSGYLCSGEFARELIEHQQKKIFMNRFLTKPLHLPTVEYLINLLLRNTKDLEHLKN